MQNFKEQDNEYFRGETYREALGFYTQGVDAKAGRRAVERGIVAESRGVQISSCVHHSLPLAKLICEGVEMGLENYGSVLRDYARQSSSRQTLVRRKLTTRLPCGTRTSRARTGRRGARRVSSCRRGRGGRCGFLDVAWVR